MSQEPRVPREIMLERSNIKSDPEPQNLFSQQQIQSDEKNLTTRSTSNLSPSGSFTPS